MYLTNIQIARVQSGQTLGWKPAKGRCQSPICRTRIPLHVPDLLRLHRLADHSGYRTAVWRPCSPQKQSQSAISKSDGRECDNFPVDVLGEHIVTYRCIVMCADFDVAGLHAGLRTQRWFIYRHNGELRHDEGPSRSIPRQRLHPGNRLLPVSDALLRLHRPACDRRLFRAWTHRSISGFQFHMGDYRLLSDRLLDLECQWLAL